MFGRCLISLLTTLVVVCSSSFDVSAQNVAKNVGPQTTVEVVQLDVTACLLYTSPSPRDLSTSRMPSSA